MIELKNVSYGYNKNKILKGIDMQFERGKLYAIIGPNGCGKTTLVRLLANLNLPQNGEILLNSKPYSNHKRKELAKNIALLPQGRHTPQMQVYDIVASGRYPYLDISRRMTEADRKAVETAMLKTDTLQFANREALSLSGGELQRLYLAMLLAQDTPCVLLDEPTTYLDISCRFQVMEILRSMRNDGKCVITVLHDLELALKFADEVIVMSEGTVVSKATPEKLVKSGVIESVFGVECKTVLCDSGTEYIFTKK